MNHQSCYFKVCCKMIKHESTVYMYNTVYEILEL